jgi:HTH-type transcriptional regulator/antitoxin HigA
MLDKQSSSHVSPIVAPIESDFSLDETDTNVFRLQKQASAVFDLSLMPSDFGGSGSIERAEILDPNTDLGSSSLVTAVKNLIDIIGKSETSLFASLTENDYQGLVTVLDDLIDVVGENESHILAFLMDFIGTLIENYEDKYVPELTIV